MRTQFCDALVQRAANPDMLFLTGDLGFMALEPLQKALGPRFINAGVAEQNMITVSAALARQGFDVWVYSIAPFCYARPFEQVRNDIAFHGLPVKLIGNGGGYGYGVMGPTHHAIEDYGVLLTLPNVAVFAPTFDEDVAAMISVAGSEKGPVYVRLGRGEPPRGYSVPPYRPWRRLTRGGGMAVIALGPLASTYIEALTDVPEATRPNLWALNELPLARHPLPEELSEDIRRHDGVCVAEEHVPQGGLASQLALFLATAGVIPKRFISLAAQAHHYDRYGSQNYLRKRSHLDAASLFEAIAT